MRDKMRLALAALALLLCAGAVQAVPVNFSLTGNINVADPGNDFGLSIGDTVTLSGMFDDAGLTGIGVEIINFGDLLPGNMFTLPLDSVSLDNTMDVFFALGCCPFIELLDGDFVFLDYVVERFVNGAPDVDFLTGTPVSGLDPLVFVATDSASRIIEGTWNPDSFTVTPKGVPEPTTLALIGLGLASLGFAGRRRVRA